MRTVATDIPSARPAHSPQSTKCMALLAVALLLVSSPAWATPQLYPGNGHYYEVIPVLEGISWADAQAVAASQVWQEQQGHLATIASAEENQFAFDLSLGLGIWHVSTVWTVGPWIGGFQQDGAAEPAGGWGWITGEPWGYTNWMSGQPNNNSPPVNENRLLFWGQSAITPTWNDYVEAPPLYPLEDRVWGYVVEFDTAWDPPETPQFFPGTGHYYQVIPVLNGISWADAQAAAASQVWQGQQGHLATFESAEENQFAFDLSLGLGIWHVSTVWTVGPWIGGFQQDGAAEPAGGWGWITGEPWDYTNWMPGQPNNNSPPVNENRLLFWGQGAITPTWNDYVAAPPLYPLADRVWGYVVEFDTPPVGVEETSWGQIKALFN